MHKQFKRLLSVLICVSMLSVMFMPQSIYAQENAILPQTVSDVDVWVQNSADRAFDSSEKPRYAPSKIDLFSAKNEYEAAQILVRSKSPINQLTVTSSVLTSGDGATIPVNNIEIFSEYSAPAEVPGDIEPTPDGSNSYTDTLFPQKPLTVAADKTQPYWVRVHTSGTQKQGIYNGTVTVSSTDGTIATVPLSLKVYDVTIPKTSEANFKTINWFGSAGCDYGALESSVPSQYDVDMYDDNWWKVMENFAKDLSIHRNNVEFIDFQALLIPDAVFDSKGNYTFDWTKFNRLVDIFINAGALQYIYSPGSYLDMSGDGKMSLWSIGSENSKNTRVKIPLYTDASNKTINPVAEKYIQTLFTALKAHMEAKYPTYVDKFYISAQDEPSKQVQYDAANWFYKETRKYYPELLSNEAHSRFITGIKETTTLCPVLDVYETNQKFYKEQQAAGKELWYYTCIGPQGDYLNRFIPYHLAKTRLIPWYAYQIDATGYLHWGYCWWRNVETFDSKQTGDEWLVRPDKENFDVFTSVRNEAQLDGLEDYELLAILKKKYPDTAQSIVDNMIQTATDYTKSGTSVTNAHKVILDAIEVDDGTSGSVPLEVFSEDFSSKYDSAWMRTVGNWIIEDGGYKNTATEALSVLRDFELTNGEITFDVIFAQSNKGGFVGIDVRKTGSALWADGYKVLINADGHVEFLNGKPNTKADFTKPVDGICTFTLKMKGDTITLYQAGVETALLSMGGCSTSGKGFGLTAMYGTSYIDNIKISSYEGPKEILDTKVIEDLSYSDKFNDTTLANWEKIGGNPSVSDGKLVFVGSTTTGLKKRVFSDIIATFTLDLTGAKTTPDAKDFWGGMTFGNDRPYGSVWDGGSCMLLVRSTGKVELMTSKGAVATGTTTADFTKPVQVKLVKDGVTVKVYINDEEIPTLSVDNLPIGDGFVGFNSDGGTVFFDNLSVTGLIKSGNSELIDDFSGDLSKWTKTDYPEDSQIKGGVLYTNGVSATPGNGVSPGLLLKDKTFTNAMFSADIKIDKVAQQENWAGIYFNSPGQNGFWKSGGYLLYITNKSEIVLYKHGANNLKTAKMGVDPTEDFVNITISVMDSKIKVYVNNSTKPVIEATDSGFTSGYFGLMSDFCDARFDNVKYIMPDMAIDDFTEINSKWVSNNATATTISNGTLKLNGIDKEAGVTPAPTMTLKEKVIANGNVSFDMKLNKKLDQTSWAGCTIRTKTAEGFEASDGYKVTLSTAGKVTLSTKAGELATADSKIDFTQAFVNVRVALERDRIQIYLNNNITPIIETQETTMTEGYFALISNQANTEFDNIKGQGIKPEDPSIDYPVIDEAFSDSFDTVNAKVWRNSNSSEGNFTITNSQLNLIGTSGANAAIAGIKGYSYGDAIMEFDMTMNTKQAWSGVALRRTKWNDSIWVSGYFLYYSDNGGLNLFKANVGDVVKTNIGAKGNEPIHFKVVMFENRIRVYIDGQEKAVIDYTDKNNTFTNGYVGLCSYMANAKYDNVSITPYDGNEEPEAPVEPADKLNVAFSDGFSQDTLSNSWETLNESNATWTLTDGKISALSVSSSDSQISLKNHIYTDATMSFDMSQTHGSDDAWSYVSFRKTNKSDGIWNSGYFMFYNPNKGWLKIYNTTVGEFGEVDIGISKGETRHFDIVMKGNNFKIYVDGAETPAIDYTDEANKYPQGYVALGVINHSQASFDNLSITPTSQPSQTYTVSFDVDGTVTTATANIGEAITIPANPIMVGYTFKGWFTLAMGGTVVTDFTTTKTVYAQFQKDTTPPPTTIIPSQPEDKVVEDSNDKNATAFVPKQVTNVANPILYVSELPQWSDTVKKFAKAAKDYSLIKTFMINLYDSNTLVEKVEGGKIKITIPFAGDVGKEYSVLRYNDALTVTTLTTTCSNGKIVFETDHFSTYAIAVKSDIISTKPITEVPKTSDTTPIGTFIMLVLLSCVAIIMKKRITD